MLYEKKKIWKHRVICLALLLVFLIIIPSCISSTPKNVEEIEIVEDNCYIEKYYEYTDTTSCKIEVQFNTDVDPGYITVAFYDNKNKLLENEKSFFYGYGTTLSASFYVDGKVDKYKIEEYDISASYDDSNEFISLCIFFFSLCILLPFFIGSLFLSCKEYDYLGKQIVVYAGWCHHYIKVDGIKTDEHNTLISHTAIQLSCTLFDGTNIQATITLSNRISLKINNLLYENHGGK